jgi:tRNA(adenine34) deaminase
MEKIIKYMKEALKEAKKAELIDEVPIGCVIVKDDKIIARGHNQRETNQSPIGHAEIIAINKASKKLKSWRLEGCDIYVTLEPCIMCSGAIIQSRINKVYYGASDPKGGALGSSINVLEANNINHHPEVVSGVLKEECSSIITNYFKAKRQSK